MNHDSQRFNATWKLNLVIPFLLLSLLGCSPQQGKKQLQKDQAVAIAKKEVINKLGWSENMEVVSASFTDNRWLIQLWMLPKTPGGFATVEVSTQGQASIPRMPR